MIYHNWDMESSQVHSAFGLDIMVVQFVYHVIYMNSKVNPNSGCTRSLHYVYFILELILINVLVERFCFKACIRKYHKHLSLCVFFTFRKQLYLWLERMRTLLLSSNFSTSLFRWSNLVHSFIQAISIAPLQVHFYSEALPTQHGYCAGVSRQSATGNCELRTCPWSLYGG